MKIDRNLTPIEIHKAIYAQVLTLGLKHRFKSKEGLEDKWYRDADEGPFLLFPHSSIDDPDKALNASPYPNVWIRHNPGNGELEYGIAFGSATSVDQRLANFIHPGNEEQRMRVLSMLKALPDNWMFRVYKKKKQGLGEVVFEKTCNGMGQDEIAKAISDILAWRAQWKKDTAERGNGAAPAIDFMRGTSAPEEADQRIRELFDLFDVLAEMTPSKTIVEDLKKMKKEIQSKIGNLEENSETSHYKKEIESRLKGLRSEMERVDSALQGILVSR